MPYSRAPPALPLPHAPLSRSAPRRCACVTSPPDSPSSRADVECPLWCLVRLPPSVAFVELLRVAVLLWGSAVSCLPELMNWLSFVWLCHLTPLSVVLLCLLTPLSVVLSLPHSCNEKLSFSTTDEVSLLFFKASHFALFLKLLDKHRALGC